MYREGIIFRSTDTCLMCLTYFSVYVGHTQGFIEELSSWDRSSSGKRTKKNPTWESSGLSPQTTRSKQSRMKHLQVPGASAAATSCILSTLLNRFRFNKPTPNCLLFSNQRWPSWRIWNQGMMHCLSYRQLSNSSTASPPVKTNKILVIYFTSSFWVCMMSQCLTLRAYGPRHPYHPVSAGSLPTQCVCDPQVRVRSSDLQRSKHVAFVWVCVEMETVTLVSLGVR